MNGVYLQWSAKAEQMKRGKGEEKKRRRRREDKKEREKGEGDNKNKDGKKSRRGMWAEMSLIYSLRTHASKGSSRPRVIKVVF